MNARARCDCPSFDPEAGSKTVCDCGHTDTDHEAGGGPCMSPLPDPDGRANTLATVMRERYGPGGGG